MKRSTVQIAKDLIKKWGLERVSFNDFLNACEYSFEELKSNSRERELVDWRNVGMLVVFNEKRVLSQAGRVFKKNHSTVIHSIKELDNEYPTVLENIHCLKYYTQYRKHYCMTIQLESFTPKSVA